MNLTSLWSRARVARTVSLFSVRRLAALPAVAVAFVLQTAPAFCADAADGHGAHGEHFVPSLIWAVPFAILLLSIAILPLIPKVEHWWHKNSSKLLVATILAAITLAYYGMREVGFHAEPGFATVKTVVKHAALDEYIPFIVLLFSLYTISGGIRLEGSFPAHPSTNLIFLLIGTSLASFIGTTGASMLLIRPLLEINKPRKHVRHTVIFFIFLVSNIGGSLLPVGDPPLFLGYLRGVPFMWTFNLLIEWAVCLVILMGVYAAFDFYFYSKEDKAAIRIDESRRKPVRLSGGFNFLLLFGVVAAVAVVIPGRKLMGWTVPNVMLREWIQLGLAGLSMFLTPRAIREANRFNFFPIAEVACLFIGIFITMQVPLEILNARGSELGLSTPAQFFWATGLLSGVLDNAPTYVVFFQTAGTLHPEGMQLMPGVLTSTGEIAVPLLVAISCGSVFMGALTYIGNGPNFMVKAIAESEGVRMPTFFGYMAYSFTILIPIFVLLTFLFFL